MFKKSVIGKKFLRSSKVKLTCHNVMFCIHGAIFHKFCFNLNKFLLIFVFLSPNNMCGEMKSRSFSLDVNRNKDGTHKMGCGIDGTKMGHTSIGTRSVNNSSLPLLFSTDLTWVTLKTKRWIDESRLIKKGRTLFFA